MLELLELDEDEIGGRDTDVPNPCLTTGGLLAGTTRPRGGTPVLAMPTLDDALAVGSLRLDGLVITLARGTTVLANDNELAVDCADPGRVMASGASPTLLTTLPACTDAFEVPIGGRAVWRRPSFVAAMGGGRTFDTTVAAGATVEDEGTTFRDSVATFVGGVARFGSPDTGILERTSVAGGAATSPLRRFVPSGTTFFVPVAILDVSFDSCRLAVGAAKAGAAGLRSAAEGVDDPTDVAGEPFMIVCDEGGEARTMGDGADGRATESRRGEAGGVLEVGASTGSETTSSCRRVAVSAFGHGQLAYYI
jgi:hypothetical protein